MCPGDESRKSKRLASLIFKEIVRLGEAAQFLIILDVETECLPINPGKGSLTLARLNFQKATCRFSHLPLSLGD